LQLNGSTSRDLATSLGDVEADKMGKKIEEDKKVLYIVALQYIGVKEKILRWMKSLEKAHRLHVREAKAT
jgi:hypothetical protein